MPNCAIQTKGDRLPIEMAMSSGDGSSPPRSLNLSKPVTSPVVSVPVEISLLSTLRYVSGFSGEESLQSGMQRVRL